MSKKKTDLTTQKINLLPMQIFFLISPFFFGGFHVFVSCIFSVIIFGYLFFLSSKKPGITVRINDTLLAVVVFLSFYLLSSIWSVDSGMAVMGFWKFLPIFPFLLIIMQLDEENWFALLTQGCSRIGRNLNDTRVLFHSFRDARGVMRSLLGDLERLGAGGWKEWEIAFELRINRAKWIRIYADVLIITEHFVFSLEFKMKDKIDPEEVSQAAKYSPYLEVLFGQGYDVIPVLVLTRASDLYTYAPLPGTSAEIPVCSGDMLFNIFDEYMGFLED
jgi:hypothetical protein